MSRDYESMTVAEQIRAGLEDSLAYTRGELTLVTTTLPSPPLALNAAGVTRIRKRLRMSQGVFAAALNVSPKTVQSWEQGIRQPSQGALRLLEIFDRQPEVVDTLFARNGAGQSAGTGPRMSERANGNRDKRQQRHHRRRGKVPMGRLGQ